MVARFSIIPGDDFIWNQIDLIEFLCKNQGRDIVVDTNSESCCARSVGLYEYLQPFCLPNVTLQTANPLEFHQSYHIRFNGWHWLHQVSPVSTDYHHWTREKIFGALYGRAIWHRLGIASHLVKNHNVMSIVGLRANHKTEDGRRLVEMQKLWQAHPLSVNAFCSVIDSLPWHLSDVANYAPALITRADHGIAAVQSLYPKFLIDVVAETYTSGRCFCVTEKTVRPIIMKKPMILMGAKHSLHYLRQMGFKTFGDFWSEDYDDYESNLRYERILYLIDWLADQPKSVLSAMYNDMTKILDHNYHMLIECRMNFDIKYKQDWYE